MVKIEAKRQTASISFSSEFDDREDFSQNWEHFCKELGQNLLAKNSGFLGFYHCEPVDGSPQMHRRWIIKFIERKNFLELRVIHKSSESDQSEIVFEFGTNGQALPHLDKQLLAQAFARLLTEALPLGISLAYDGSPVTLKALKDLPAPPHELLVFTLGYNAVERTFEPRFKGRLLRQEGANSSDSLQQEVYEFEGNRPLIQGKNYWLHSPEGPGYRTSTYRAIIGDLLHGSSLSGDSFLNRLFFESFRSSYAGFRYGQSLLGNKKSIVSQSHLISSLVEIRGGPLSGLRAYYDSFPEVGQGTGTQAETFSLRRMSLGWSITALTSPSPQGFITNVDLQPKLGLLDLSTNFVIPGNTQAKGAFTAKKVYNLALEAGLEKTASWFRVRLWASVDTAFPGLTDKQKVSVSSTRIGLDSYYNIYDQGDGLAINLLVFGVAEQMSFRKDPLKNSEKETNEQEVSEFGFNLFHAGAGFTLSW
ncbi:MAG: hypothetical protein H7318_10740 [Oligoflexus sp.]|nr:hypothetical protein [Oligoflexus sp.]